MTRSSRHNFTTNQRALIYARDRATCAFSGKNLWLLDYGLSGFGDHDWTDHERPCTRGGNADLDNGVCASYTYNAKKGANGRDRLFLFKNGSPTESYFYFFGPLSADMRAQLVRDIRSLDWYFNRMLAMIDLALQKKYDKSADPRDWATSAWRRQRDWKTKGGTVEDLIERALVRFPEDRGTSLLLGMAQTESRLAFDRILKQVYSIYALHQDTLSKYWDSNDRDAGARLLDRVSDGPRFHPAIRKILASHEKFRIAKARGESRKARAAAHQSLGS